MLGLSARPVLVRSSSRASLSVASRAMEDLKKRGEGHRKERDLNEDFLESTPFDVVVRFEPLKENRSYVRTTGIILESRRLFSPDDASEASASQALTLSWLGRHRH
jgi:hypothetical protein